MPNVRLSPSESFVRRRLLPRILLYAALLCTILISIACPPPPGAASASGSSWLMSPVWGLGALPFTGEAKQDLISKKLVGYCERSFGGQATLMVKASSHKS